MSEKKHQYYTQMDKKLSEKHSGTLSAIIVCAFFLVLLLLASSCKSSNHVVTVVTTDTLHIYHTDTLKVVHNDTVYSVKVETKHDSIIIKEKEKIYLDSDGNVLHSEKEKEKESWHNSDTNSSLIQHTVDSILQVKMDSIYQSKHEEEPVIVEVEKEMPWYKKAWNWIVNKFAYIGFTILIFLLIDRYGWRLLDWIHRISSRHE